MIQVIYYLIISVFSLLLLFGMMRRKPFNELACIAMVLVTFALRALHIK
ncbi:MAG: hypothetical protein SO135_01725 [Sphaerochaetaceae bacterium]|jgi:hypothetical protein|nr:hypothetical protein [Sphaerochaetaceae bacterium]NLY07087.1 hypothetical protein [Spirochaetales bacterium]